MAGAPAENAIRGCGQSHRARCICPETDLCQTRRYRHSRTGGGATGNEARPARIDGGPEMPVDAEQRIGEFIGLRLAHEGRTRLQKALDGWRRLAFHARSGENQWVSSPRRVACDIEEVFDRKAKPCKRACFRMGHGPIGKGRSAPDGSILMFIRY